MIDSSSLVIVTSETPFEDLEKLLPSANTFLYEFRAVSISQVLDACTDLKQQIVRASNASPQASPSSLTCVDGYADVTISFENGHGCTSDLELELLS